MAYHGSSLVDWEEKASVPLLPYFVLSNVVLDIPACAMRTRKRTASDVPAKKLVEVRSALFNPVHRKTSAKAVAAVS